MRPARDDKVVAAWNGLAITGLCEAGTLLGEPAYIDAAVAAGRLLIDVHLVDPATGSGAPGRPRRGSLNGAAGRPPRRPGAASGPA